MQKEPRRLYVVDPDGSFRVPDRLRKGAPRTQTSQMDLDQILGLLRYELDELCERMEGGEKA